MRWYNISECGAHQNVSYVIYTCRAHVSCLTCSSQNGFAQIHTHTQTTMHGIAKFSLGADHFNASWAHAFQMITKRFSVILCHPQLTEQYVRLRRNYMQNLRSLDATECHFIAFPYCLFWNDIAECMFWLLIEENTKHSIQTALLLCTKFPLLHQRNINSISTEYRLHKIVVLKYSYLGNEVVKIASVFIDSLQPLKCDAIIFVFYSDILSIPRHTDENKYSVILSIWLFIRMKNIAHHILAHIGTFYFEFAMWQRKLKMACKRTHIVYVVKPFVRALHRRNWAANKILIKWRNIRNTKRCVYNTKPSSSQTYATRFVYFLHNTFDCFNLLCPCLFHRMNSWIFKCVPKFPHSLSHSWLN